MDKVELVKAIRAYAVAHYNEGGWDNVVEAYTDGEILKEIDGATTLKEALKRLGAILECRKDYEYDIQLEAF